MRYITAFLLLTHGTICMLGFVSAFKLAAVPGMSGQTLWPLSAGLQRALGLAWLLVALGLVLAAFLRWRDVGSWWLVAGAAVVVSQALIVVHWPEAKAGTLVNVLLALAVLFAAAGARFDAAGRRQAERLLSGPLGAPTILTHDELAPLPSPCDFWGSWSGFLQRPPRPPSPGSLSMKTAPGRLCRPTGSLSPPYSPSMRAATSPRSAPVVRTRAGPKRRGAWQPTSGAPLMVWSSPLPAP